MFSAGKLVCPCDQSKEDKQGKLLLQAFDIMGRIFDRQYDLELAQKEARKKQKREEQRIKNKERWLEKKAAMKAKKEAEKERYRLRKLGLLTPIKKEKKDAECPAAPRKTYWLRREAVVVIRPLGFEGEQ